MEMRTGKREVGEGKMVRGKRPDRDAIRECGRREKEAIVSLQHLSL
jgi:hypothetical protein